MLDRALGERAQPGRPLDAKRSRQLRCRNRGAHADSRCSYRPSRRRTSGVRSRSRGWTHHGATRQHDLAAALARQRLEQRAHLRAEARGARSAPARSSSLASRLTSTGGDLQLLQAIELRHVSTASAGGFGHEPQVNECDQRGAHQRVDAHEQGGGPCVHASPRSRKTASMAAETSRPAARLALMALKSSARLLKSSRLYRIDDQPADAVADRRVDEDLG